MVEEPDSDWWRTWFGPSYLALYDETLRERTPVEIDRLEALLTLRPPLRILDLPCGQGRHAIELARRGYEVTGMDISPFMIEVASERAKAIDVKVRWLTGDMRTPIPGARFDLVLNLFTSFGYFADEADDHHVLEAAVSMLRPGGRFVLEVINGERIMAEFEERGWFTVGSSAVMETRRLDRSSHQMVVERTVSTPPETETSVHSLRLYTGVQIEGVMRKAGFRRLDLYGDWSGEPLQRDRSIAIVAVGSID
jgi:SAM-dependent methyltransferase